MYANVVFSLLTVLALKPRPEFPSRLPPRHPPPPRAQPPPRPLRPDAGGTDEQVGQEGRGRHDVQQQPHPGAAGLRAVGAGHQHGGGHLDGGVAAAAAGLVGQAGHAGGAGGAAAGRRSWWTNSRYSYIEQRRAMEKKVRVVEIRK